MATSAATVLRAYNFERLRDQLHTNTDEYEVMTCRVDCEYITTAYATDDDSSLAPATAIANALRDGRTATIIDSCFVAPGQYSLAATPTTYVLAGAGPCTTVSSGTITNPLTAEDLATEMTNTTALNTATWQIPITYQVTFMVKALCE
jgi:hypothetical protein